MEFAKHVPLYWTAVAAIYVVDAYQDARNRQLRTADLEARLAEARLQNLRLQLQPHFLFNALNTISSVMYEDVERADNMLARLGDLLRRTLNAAEAQEISLQEELGLVESYLAIMQERFGEDLQIAFEIDPELMQALVPQLVLQPLVENSLRYGRDLVTSKVTLRISASRSSTGVLLQVRDGGPGIVGLEANGWRKGIGIGNTEQRLLALYGEAEPLLLENTNGLTVSIRIPLRWGSARI
nr:histidine kinase [Granulicella arctica]